MTVKEAKNETECFANYLAKGMQGANLQEALFMAAKALELMGYILDRPCECCKHHTTGECVVWTCVFDEWLHEHVYGKGDEE